VTTETAAKSAPAEEPKPLLKPREAAKRLQTSAGVLAVWRCHRSQPLTFVRIGRKIFYRPEDIEAFIQQGRVAGDSPKLRRGAKKQRKPR
jgi:Helix-turn-helix domain